MLSQAGATDRITAICRLRLLVQKDAGFMGSNVQCTTSAVRSDFSSEFLCIVVEGERQCGDELVGATR